MSKNSIGADCHLSFDGTAWSWTSQVPVNSLLWGFDNPRSLESAAQALAIDIDIFEDTPWKKSREYLVDPGCGVRWIDCMPRHVWKSRVQEAARQLWSHFSDEDNSYYVSTHLRNRELIYGLSRVQVDPFVLIEKIKASNPNIKRSLMRFKPDREGYCPEFKYSLSKSVTGRMTITDGPNVLTMKKSDRDIFKSRFSDGAIVEVDIVSAEPRVALSLFGKSIEGDVYSDLLDRAGLNISRPEAKIATLSALYGASHHTIKSKISDTSRSAEILDLVKDYFGVSHIEKMINDQFADEGHVKNTHGRKIFTDPPSLNHFIQSSAVDVSFDIFDALLGKIREKDIDAVPVFLIHDAIGIDIRRGQLEMLIEACNEGLFSRTIGINFPVRIKEIK